MGYNIFLTSWTDYELILNQFYSSSLLVNYPRVLSIMLVSMLIHIVIRVCDRYADYQIIH